MNSTLETIEKEDSSHNAINLFLRWFLLKETLVKDEKVAQLLSDMDQGLVRNEGEWADSIRKSLLPHVVGVLSGLLERPLREDELLYVFGKIEQFISLYGNGSVPGGDLSPN
ncbi:MAG TPA: hypothetical protein VMV05_12580 [bacterium]|nr:hypothetical protein [bacterium]